MQLYGLDGNSLILASFAEKQKNYRCPECAHSLRVRRGPLRQTHFYHTARSPACRQGRKTHTHLRIQQQLQALLPKGETSLEHHFPEVGRIGDLYWKERQIVFEVQCSPLSAEEAEARCHDYRSLGITPVWILYSGRYNRHFSPPAETLLRQGLCYFTDGRGLFYDQVETLSGAKRIYRGPRLHVDLSNPLSSPTLHFAGDCLSRYGVTPSKRTRHQPIPWRAKVKRFYRSLLYLLLEKTK